MSVANIKRLCRLCLQVICAGLLSIALLPQLHADGWSKSTKFTFTDPVQIPGQVLPPGTYVFRLLDSKSDRHVVQVWDENDMHLIATVLAINNYRIEAKGKTTLTFSERHMGNAEAIKTWFYPGDNFGQEFVYPKGEELQTAEVTPAPATPPPAEAAPAAVEPAAPPPAQEAPQETAPSAEPEQQPAPPAAEAPAPEEPAPAPAEPESLPQTGSELPLIGLLGFTSLGSGVLSRILRRR